MTSYKTSLTRQNDSKPYWTLLVDADNESDARVESLEQAELAGHKVLSTDFATVRPV